MWLIRLLKSTLNDFKSRSQFYAQAACGTFMIIFQIKRLLEATEGQSVMPFIAGLGHMLLSFLITKRGIREALAEGETPPPKVYDTLRLFKMWIVYDTLSIVVAAMWSSYEWGFNDTISAILVGSGVTTVAATAWSLEKIKDYEIPRKWWEPLGDIVPQGLFAMLCHSVTQFMLAIKIWDEGGKGLHGVVVVTVNVGLFFRLWLIIKEGRTAKWNEYYRWLLGSEILNEVSWLAVTIAWLNWFFA